MFKIKTFLIGCMIGYLLSVILTYEVFRIVVTPGGVATMPRNIEDISYAFMYTFTWDALPIVSFLILFFGFLFLLISAGICKYKNRRKEKK
jgi:ABC-type antimicrobial peptide transport system permease subunit